MERNETPPPSQPKSQSVFTQMLLQDAKQNYQSFMMNEHQQKQDDRYDRLLADLGLEDAKGKDFNNYLNNK